MRRSQQRNPLGLAARNIRHHYDIPPDFYRLWLDETMNYSCAYFTSPGVSLHQAQIDKMRHIAAKLKLEPGMRVAEIGSGYGAGDIPGANTTCASPRCRCLPETAVAKARAVREGVADRSASSSRTTGRWTEATTAWCRSP